MKINLITLTIMNRIENEPFWRSHHEFSNLYACINFKTVLKYSHFVWFVYPWICIEKQKSGQLNNYKLSNEDQYFVVAILTSIYSLIKLILLWVNPAIQYSYHALQLIIQTILRVATGQGNSRSGNFRICQGNLEFCWRSGKFKKSQGNLRKFIFH